MANAEPGSPGSDLYLRWLKEGRNMICAINYDLEPPSQNYKAPYSVIKSGGATWRYHKSTWLVATALTPNASGTSWVGRSTRKTSSLCLRQP